MRHLRLGVESLLDLNSPIRKKNNYFAKFLTLCYSLFLLTCSSAYGNGVDEGEEIYKSLNNNFMFSDYFDGGVKKTWEIHNVGNRKIIKMVIIYSYVSKNKDVSEEIILKNINPNERRRYFYFIENLNEFNKRSFVLGISSVDFEE